MEHRRWPTITGHQFQESTMNQQEFLSEAQPMIQAVEEAMHRMFDRQTTPEQLRADLERKDERIEK